MTAALQGGGGVYPSARDLAGQVLEELPRADFTTRIEIRKRARELIELATEEGFKLPMPAGWIARLEMHGYVVDLKQGIFVWGGDGEAVVPTPAAWAMRERGEVPRGEWGK